MEQIRLFSLAVMAEWLRREARCLLGIKWTLIVHACAGSNPADSAFIKSFSNYFHFELKPKNCFFKTTISFVIFLLVYVRLMDSASPQFKVKDVSRSNCYF